MSSWQSRIVGSGTEEPGQLLANPRNWRVHNDLQRSAIKAVLDEVGWVQNVIVNRLTGYIVDGHLRVGVALERGEAEVPVVYVELSEEEEALILATLDPIGGMATTDQEMLNSLLAEVETDNPALQALIDSLVVDAEGPLEETEEQGLTDDDDVPGEREETVSRQGDLWILGEHRLHVGDSTSVQALGYLMQGDQADLVWTDPPYNVAYETKAGSIQNDDMSDQQFYEFLLGFYQAAIAVTRPGGAVYIAHADSEGLNFRRAMIDAGWLLKQNLIWVKSSATLSRQDYNWRHEPILYGWKPGAAHYYCQDFTQTTVVDDTKDLKALSRGQLETLCQELLDQVITSVVYEDKPSRSELHPTMKPVKLVQRFVANSSKRGEIVLDTFGGSGTTLIACQKIGRRARLNELDEKYADIIIRRWQDWTGMVAVHFEEQKQFSQVEAERLGKSRASKGVTA
ncbi:DNA modification methylase [Pseudomonas alloputida]|uniref:DNA modification methylase n=1 Tax=Pseudomonas alloputida TaxID=1940621 RepID=UPI00386CCC33